MQFVFNGKVYSYDIDLVADIIKAVFYSFHSAFLQIQQC